MDAQKHFYSELYSRKPVDLNNEETQPFLENLNTQRQSKELSASCEGKITLQECEGILSSFQTGKTPGNDGILVEFYKTFWPLIGNLMTDSINEAFLKKTMSSLQKQAVIALIEKKGKDRNYLENWRPILLTKVFPEIIHPNQLGYVKGRFTGEAA